MDERLTSHQHRALAVYFPDCFDSVLLELPMSSFFSKNRLWVLRSWCFFSWTHNIKKLLLSPQNQNFLLLNETRKQVADVLEHIIVWTTCQKHAAKSWEKVGTITTISLPNTNQKFLKIFMFSVMITPLKMWWNIFLKWKRTIVIFFCSYLLKRNFICYLESISIDFTLWKHPSIFWKNQII